MLNISRLLTLLFLFLLTSSFAKEFEGKIIFKVITANQETEMIYYLKDGAVRIDINDLGGYTLVKDGKSFLVMSENKSYMNMGKAGSTGKNPLNLGKEKNLNQTGKSKVINGFKCYQYIMKDESEEVILWATEDFVSFPGFTGEGDEIGPYLGKENFFPLEIEAEAFGNRMKMVVDKILEEKLDSILFEIPNNFKEVILPGK